MKIYSLKTHDYKSIPNGCLSTISSVKTNDYFGPLNNLRHWDFNITILKEGTDVIRGWKNKFHISHLFEDKIKLVGVLKEFNELDYVRVSLAVVESLHFAEHPGTGVPRHFIDDLHCELLTRIDVHARLYRSVCALA